MSEQEWEGGIGGAEEEAEADSLPDQQKLDAGLYPDPRASEIMTWDKVRYLINRTTQAPLKDYTIEKHMLLEIMKCIINLPI